MDKKRVFSGIQPSGDLHIGNYLGAIINWVRGQDEKDNIFCIVDLHAITVPQNPVELKKRILDIAKIYLAAGIDPKKSTIFVQSSRPEHSELTWLLNCSAYMGELSRMTQFKDKTINKNDSISVGLFDYPVLMAADILLYDTDEVPVGEDQKQHVEITRDIAERVNNRFGEIFVIPKPVIQKEGARIMNLQDPTKKMSKSDENPNSRIEVLDSPEIIRQKIARAVTDSDDKIRYDIKNKPGISNLLSILSVISETSIPELEKKYENSNYGGFKNDIAEAIIGLLEPFQARFNSISDEEVRKVLKEGAKKIEPRAKATLERLQKAIGLGI